MGIRVEREDETVRIEVCDHDGTNGAARRVEGDLGVLRLWEDVADAVRGRCADREDCPERGRVARGSSASRPPVSTPKRGLPRTNADVRGRRREARNAACKSRVAGR